MNVLSEEKKQQVLALGRLGWSLRKIEEATGVRRETVGRYLRAQGIEVRRPGGWSRGTVVGKQAATSKGGLGKDGEGEAGQGEGQAKAAIEGAWVPTGSWVGEECSGQVASEPAASRASGAAARCMASACEPYRELILTALSDGRIAMSIWQDLVDIYGFAGGYDSVKRFVRKLRGASSPEARVVIETRPGEEAQVDWGTGPQVLDSRTGKYRKTRLFVMTLAHSRKSVRLIAWKSGTQVWAQLHEEAFRRLGGATRVVVLDNLREGVIAPDIYDPTINPLYRDVLKHYGVVALPCRVRDPDRKGKVESGVGHAQKTPLRGRKFESIEEAQAYLDHWESHWADTRIHGTMKRQVAAMFAEERPALLPLPVQPFRYYKYGERTVHLDGCIEVEAAYYSAPPGWIGKRVPVQWNDVHVRLIHPQDGQLLREHLRQPRGGRRIAEQDKPAQTPLSTLKLFNRAATAGKHIGALARSFYEREGQAAVRRILGLLSYAKKFGAASCEEACEMAVETGGGYHFVRKYLERRKPPLLNLNQIDPIIRQLTLYRDLIEQRAALPTNKENPL